MDEILCLLIKNALEAEVGSADYEKAVQALSLVIDQLPDIKARLSKGLLSYYDRALPKTMRDIERKFPDFLSAYQLNTYMYIVDWSQPSDSASIRKYFVQWVTLILKRDCMDVWRSQRTRPREFSINAPINKEEGATTFEDIVPAPTLSQIELMLEQERSNMAKQLRQYVEEDPDGELKGCHVRSRNDLNCQTLIQMRFLQVPPATLKEISQDLNTPLKTVADRLQNYCLPLLSQITKKLGYE